ncbi:unnamed protein product [Paramecium primaurelia]|uniref:Uncharacterized protein n=1 Tax=Paramecium primaurelia TaxID=5886 RepID=A0A8S1K5R1_PARPR|nr:unnamed protein product [Paramecium primaurelia]
MKINKIISYINISQVKKSLLKVEKLQFDIFINKQLFQVNYNEQITVGDILDFIKRIHNISNSDIFFYLAKKSCEAKLSFPTLESNRKLIKNKCKKDLLLL